jgi:hypothetical protein
MRRFLELRNQPASVNEIAAYVIERRTAQETSIAMYLQLDKSFVEVSRGQWALAHWAEARSVKIWRRPQVAEFVAKYFREHKLPRGDYKELRAALMTEAGVSEKTAAGMLAWNPAIKIEDDASGRRIAVFQPDYAQALREGVAYVRRKKTLTATIGEDIVKILGSTPGKQMRLNDLVSQLQSLPQYAARDYQNLHTYVARHSSVERFRDPSTDAVMVRLKNAVAAELVAKAQSIQDEATRKEVLRAIELLTIDNVDAGLFQLSRQFETTLKGFIKQGERHGAFSRPTPADKTLVKLIAFVIEERIVEDEHALHYLRLSRNERVHGAAPSLEQRQLMMNHVTADAGKYIDYIKFFDDRTKALSST